MEVDERPKETYTDIGGLDKQIEELVEAIVLPMKHPEKFKALGIRPPKGVLMYGPPGTGKTRTVDQVGLKVPLVPVNLAPSRATRRLHHLPLSSSLTPKASSQHFRPRITTCDGG